MAQSLFVRLGLQSRDYVQGIKRAQDRTTKLKKTTETLGQSLKLLKRIAVISFAGWGVSRVAKSFIEAADTAEGFRIRLKVLLGDTEKANELFKDMAEYASAVSFEYQEIMGSATALAGVMQEGNEEIKRWMPLIADLAATSGLTIQDTTSQVIRMYSAGAAAADMFRERGILAMLGFQAGVKYTAEQTREMLIKAWLDPASKFKGASEELAKSWSGLLSMLSDKWFQFRNLVMEAGIFDALKSALEKINDELAIWIENNKELIVQDIPKYIDSITTAINALITAYKTLYEWSQKLDTIGVPKGKEEEWRKLKELFELKFGATKPGEKVAMPIAKVPAISTPSPIAIKAETSEAVQALKDLQLEAQGTYDSIASIKEGFFDFYNSLSQTREENYQTWRTSLQTTLDANAEAMDTYFTNQEERERLYAQTRMQINALMAATIENTMMALYIATGKTNKLLFYTAKAAAFSRAIVMAHVAYAQALASVPPPFNIAAANWVLGLGYSNAAMIAATTIAAKKMHEGGIVSGPNREVPVILERGEVVIPRKQVNSEWGGIAGPSLKDIHIHVMINEREIAYTTVKRAEWDPELRRMLKRAIA